VDARVRHPLPVKYPAEHRKQFLAGRTVDGSYGPGGGVKMAWVPIRRQMTYGWPGIRSCP